MHESATDDTCFSSSHGVTGIRAFRETRLKGGRRVMLGRSGPLDLEGQTVGWTSTGYRVIRCQRERGIGKRGSPSNEEGKKDGGFNRRRGRFEPSDPSATRCIES
ncbi:hypothetical protein ACLOJK_013822 [Asimina triloba]